MYVGITSGEVGPNARGERKDTRVSWLTPALTPVAQGRGAGCRHPDRLEPSARLRTRRPQRLTARVAMLERVDVRVTAYDIAVLRAVLQEMPLRDAARRY
jgi:hypothetical protein